MAVALRYFTEFGKSDLRSNTYNRVDLWRNLYTSLLYFVVRVRCRRKENSRSLSHLLINFLFPYLVSHSFCTPIPTHMPTQYHCQCHWTDDVHWMLRLCGGALSARPTAPGWFYSALHPPGLSSLRFRHCRYNTAYRVKACTQYSWLMKNSKWLNSLDKWSIWKFATLTSHAVYVVTLSHLI